MVSCKVGTPNHTAQHHNSPWKINRKYFEGCDYFGRGRCEFDHLEEPNINGKIIFTWFLRKLHWRDMDFIDSALGGGQMAGICKCGNKLSGCINLGEFLD
jgi:hypothetical protein